MAEPRGGRAGDIDEVGTRSLSEYRRRVADQSDFDCAGAKRLEQRRAELELDPLDLLDPKLLEPGLEDPALLRDNEDRRALLVADPKFLQRPAACTRAVVKVAETRAAPKRPASARRLLIMRLSFG